MWSSLLMAAAAVASAGWDNVAPERRPVEPGKVLWQAALNDWPAGFKFEKCEGAEGTVKVVTEGDDFALEIVKSNDRGWLVITPDQPFKVAEGTELQSYAYVSGERNDPEYSFGFLRMWGSKRSLAYDGSLDGRGPGGPKMDNLVNTAPGVRERKLCRFLANAEHGSEITPAIVVAGPRSRSRWSRWGVEDLQVSKANWSAFLKKIASKDRSSDRQDAAAFAAALAADIDHTAAVVREGDRVELRVDGKERPPVLFKGQISHVKGKNTYCGRKMEEQGVDIQVVTVRFGDSEQCRGWWSKDGFDVKGAAEEVRSAMRLAPKSVFVMTTILDAYPEFTAEHPEEIWIAPNGKEVWGNQTHANYWFDRSKYKSKHWPWVSYSSLKWREAAKRHLVELVNELKAQGLSKRIIGIHIGGYHDHQFAPRHADFSQCALEGFRSWQRQKFGSVRWQERPDFSKCGMFFRPGVDDAQIAYCRFLKEVPQGIYDYFAQTFKETIGKPVIAVRWCMAPFSGDYGGCLDITAFTRSKWVDVIAPQPDYQRRTPAMAIGARHPTSSYALNGKLMLSEFDFRTFGAVSSGETELRVTGLSQAMDVPMWCTTYRKVAGQQLSLGMGWWFYDMGGGWFEPDGIAADIGDSMKTIRALARNRSAAPDPVDTAIVIDEDGLYLKNMIGQYYHLDSKMLLQDQLQLLANSGVPYRMFLLRDAIESPEILKRYRTLVFAGCYSVDEPRRRLLDALKGNGRALVFLSATGAAGGAKATGFAIEQAESPQNHRVVAEPGVKENMLSFCDHGLWTRQLGVKLGGYYQPRRVTVVEKPGVKVLARYEQGGGAAVAVARHGDWMGAYIADPGGLTPQFFHRLVTESRGYAPAGYGLEVDMNADFLSVHCTIPGHYDFKLPRKCRVVNLKTGEKVGEAMESLPLDLVAGETRWYSL